MATINLSQVIRTLRDVYSIDPSAEFTAAAGQDYGYVAAYQLDDGSYIIQYGDNGETSYDLADDADDLACWLIHDLGGLDAILEAAQVRGIESIEAASDDFAGECAILITRYWYGATESTELANDNGKTLFFESAEQAQEWIDDTEDGAYYLSHNESGAPTYTIIEAI